VLVDGHQLGVAIEVLGMAGRPTGGSAREHAEGRARRPTVVFDGGSWKPGTERLLAHVDAAVCGSAFRPPSLGDGVGDGDDVDVDDVLRYLLAHGPSFAAVTDGAGPIRWADAHGGGRIHPPAVRAVDTLGAGDVLHGAFAWSLARQPRRTTASMVASLAAAARVAARSVESFGTREWLRRPAVGRFRGTL
jgi:sugar/nucleoside kinase (ribokinase family)